MDILSDLLYELELSLDAGKDSKNLARELRNTVDSLQGYSSPRLEYEFSCLHKYCNIPDYGKAIICVNILKIELAKAIEGVLIDVENGATGDKERFLCETCDYVLPEKYKFHKELIVIAYSYWRNIYDHDFKAALDSLFSIKSLIITLEYYSNPKQYKLF